MNKPKEGHQYNGYKQDPKHYSNSDIESERIRTLHDGKEIKESEQKQLNEWAYLSVGATGGPNLKGQNHGMINDRHGLVVDHLHQVSKHLRHESTHKFVQDTKGWMKRINKVS